MPVSHSTDYYSVALVRIIMWDLGVITLLEMNDIPVYTLIAIKLGNNIEYLLHVLCFNFYTMRQTRCSCS